MYLNSAYESFDINTHGIGHARLPTAIETTLVLIAVSLLKVDYQQRLQLITATEKISDIFPTLHRCK